MAAQALDLDAIASVEPREFDRGIAALRNAVRAGASAEIARFVPAALLAISSSDVLGPREQDRRSSLLMKEVPLDDRSMKEFAILAQRLSSPVRNAVTRILPAQYRQLAFDQSMTEPKAAVRPVEESNVPSRPRTLVTEQAQVLLVGTQQEHEHNDRILSREGITPIRAKTPDEVEKLLSDGVVGIVLARSCWTAISPSHHLAFLDSICRFSSFIFLKADSTGFSAPTEFERTCSIARCRGPGLHEVLHGDSANIAETDLPRLRASVDSIVGEAGVQLYPIDIPRNTARILIASIGRHVVHRQFPNTVRLTTIGTKTVQGGKSEALLVQAHPDDDGPPLIVKVAELPLLRDEMERFTHFIQPWDAQLRPQLHFHGEEGLIVFGMVDSSDEPRTPAPTIEDLLQQTLRAETGNPRPALSRDELIVLVDRTIQKVAELNRRRCLSTDFPSLAWVTLEPFDEALNRGLRWEFPSLLNLPDPLATAKDAALQLASHGTHATIHGDTHLRNVLVRFGREPCLIDYACSGPGHPCFDLVRFESSVLFRCFRMMSSEERITQLFEKLLEPASSLEKLAAEHAGDLSPATNYVAVHAAIRSRESCRHLLQQYNVPENHYLLMKLVVACQALVVPDLQTGVVRAMVAAASKAICGAK